MKRTGLIFVSALLLTLPLQGCFFVFIPGSVITAVSDTLTGAEGNHCVRASSGVGDSILLNGVVHTIKSLSGTSTRCTNPQIPIRALLVPAA